ncbi:SAC3/GANP/Nin1/mts3/eIF-3 p25 family-domain-containing protein [Flammula alnicola]|nr:SAC3/GANP/Nin1/mts3/eIF-3 p25 family-domain-containing protein [Flammula alnicola]
MDGSSYTRAGRGRGGVIHDAGGARGRPHSRNKHWSATDGGSRSSTPNRSDSERWERGGYRGGGRGRSSSRGAPRVFHNVSLRVNDSPSQQQRATMDSTPIHNGETHDEVGVEGEEHEEDEFYDEEQVMEPEAEEPTHNEINEPELNSPEEREKFYQELVKAREIERKNAIAEGKMDDPLVPKRLEDAISIVGTCMDMCPRFERYRRERENNLFEWETIPGTKRVDHNRTVKMYERAAGDKTQPSDLRPPHVLKRTLDYLFHDLLPRGGFSATFNFIRDRSRAVRNDFTMQHITGPLAIECHDRCARFHILALHFERDRPGFSIPLEEQQLMNTLQSLKEFYEDQRGRYESPTELEMRVYHRLIHIRDQKERHEDIPEYITSHPVFKLTTAFRLHVQEKSAPISKTSKLIVAEEGMQIFSQLATVLNEQGSTVMVYLVACLLERLFGKDTIDDIESIRGDLTISDIIDGVSSHAQIQEVGDDFVGEIEEVGEGEEEEEYNEEEGYDEAEGVDYEQTQEEEPSPQPAPPAPLKPSATEWLSPDFTPQHSTTSTAVPPPNMEPPPVAKSAFAGLVATPNPFGTQSVFGTSAFSTSKPAPPSVFGGSGGQTQSAFGTFGAPAPISTPAASAPNPPPPQAVTFPSPFSGVTNGFATKPPTPKFPATPSLNFFDTKPTLPPQPPGQPTPSTSIFGGSSSSPFSGGFPGGTTTSFFSTGPSKPTTPPLNPKAPEFTPPQPSKSFIFSQPLSFPSVKETVKVSTQEVTPPSMPSFTSPLTTTTTTTTTVPKVNGTTPFIGFPPSSATPTPPPSFFNRPSPPGSKSVTPPLNRPTAPPLLKIDTNTSIGSNSSPSAASPRIPPPMPRKQPISLPSTPTTLLQPPNPLLGYLRSTLEGPSISPSSSSQDVLSPLVMGSPTASNLKALNNFTPLTTPKALKRFRPSSPPPSMNGKGKAPDRFIYDIEEVEEMKKKALAFAQKSLLVKETFERWIQRATDRAAYLEARRHGDEYREKLQNSVNGRQNQILLRTSKNRLTLDKKRRISINGAILGEHGPSPLKKRARKRMSGEYRPPRTDEDLARRFKENHEEHELRWAKGSFLQVMRKHVKTLNPSTLKLPWHIWLSMNPESDATAIWLERKFDVPESGSWASESVFSIPLSSASGITAGYPGIIVFECTPLGDVADDLEKKYRILDDCSRLREIVKILSPKRHFIPSLLITCWGEQDQTFSTSDFFDMVKKLVADSVLQSYQVFAMTSATKDLDIKLDAALDSLTLDTEGKLVQTLSLRGVFKIFEPTFHSFLSEWMENCNINGRYNWKLYGQVIQASISLLNLISHSVQSLLELSGPQDPLPDFDYSQLDDCDSCYDDVNEWLSTLSPRDDARRIAMDLQSHRNIGQDFPAQIFIEHLFEMTQTRFERLYPKSVDAHRAILNSNITSSLEAFKESIRPHQMKLLQTYNFSVRRSPKRRTFSVTTSDQGSPEAKRPRLSASVTSTDGDADRTVPSTPQMNGRHTPSPTGSTVSLAPTEGPTVTVAMLRALTRDLKKKYAVGS